MDATSPRMARRAVRISTVVVSKPCLFAGPGELPHAGSKAVVFSKRPGRADHRLMRGSCVQHLTTRLNAAAFFAHARTRV